MKGGQDVYIDVKTIEQILARKSDAIVRRRYVNGEYVVEIYEAKMSWASKTTESEENSAQKC